LLSLIFMAAILNIYFYNLNVNLKYRLGLREKEWQGLEVANADFKNQLYKITDTRNLASFMQERNLISDKSPKYLEHKGFAQVKITE